MKTKIVLLTIGLLSLAFVKLDAKGQENADVILSKIDQTMFGAKDKSANVKMVMINLKNGKQKVKEATLLQKGANKKLFRYIYPKSDSGIHCLTIRFIYTCPCLKNRKK